MTPLWRPWAKLCGRGSCAPPSAPPCPPSPSSSCQLGRRDKIIWSPSWKLSFLFFEFTDCQRFAPYCSKQIKYQYVTTFEIIFPNQLQSLVELSSGLKKSWMRGTAELASDTDWNWTGRTLCFNVLWIFRCSAFSLLNLVLQYGHKSISHRNSLLLINWKKVIILIFHPKLIGIGRIDIAGSEGFREITINTSNTKGRVQKKNGITWE